MAYRNRRHRRHPSGASNVTTNPMHCCPPAETVAEELYAGNVPQVLVENCCDPLRGCMQADARTRCNFWPSFAHPRWLTCLDLHNRQISE